MAMGAQIQGVVVAWQMYDVTRDPLALGLVGLAEAAPFIGFALYAGHVADVRDRRRVALTALVLLFACALALAVASALLFAPGRGRPGAVMQGDHLRDHRRLRRRAQLPAARAQRAGRRPGPARAVSQRGRLARRHLAGGRRGGAGAGRHLLRLGRPDALVRDRRGADGGVAGDRARASAPRPRPPPARSEAALVASVREGLAFLFKRPIFMGAITLDLFAVLFGGAVAILPIFAAEILFVGPHGPGRAARRARRSAPC